ncbi:MAG: hypothetical protein ACYC6M_16445, partial [Terriglobales bacterium]
PTGVPTAQANNFLEISCWPNPPGSPNGQLYFNNSIDLTVPQRRFGNGGGPPFPTLTTASGAPANIAGADILLTDVISFDVRLLVPGVPPSVDPFVTLFQALFATPYTSGGYLYGNPACNPKTGPMFFDTWSSVNDALTGFPGYANWNQPGQATSIPLWNTATQSGPIIKAIQISIRIWDAKTNQTRQVTVVQAM